MDIPANIYLLGQRVKSLSLVKMSILEPPSWLHRGYYTILSACQLSCTSHRGSFVGGVKTRHKSTMGYTLLHPGFSRDKSIVDSAWRFELSPVGTPDKPYQCSGKPVGASQHLAYFLRLFPKILRLSPKKISARPRLLGAPPPKAPHHGFWRLRHQKRSYIITNIQYLI